MPLPRVPWFKVEVPMVTHRKLADLPSDSARWGWVCLLARAKMQQPQGTFASTGQLREEAGRFARFVRVWIDAGLLEDADDLCNECARRWEKVELRTGQIVIHDWLRHQWDPTNADRQSRHRNGESNADSNGTGNGEDNAHPRARARGDRRQVGSTEPERVPTARAEQADDIALSPIEAALSKLMRRSPAPRQLAAVEEMADELPSGIALATIENLIDERPERNVYGVLLDQLRDAKAAMRPRRNGIGPPRQRLNDYDALAEGDDEEPE